MKCLFCDKILVGPNQNKFCSLEHSSCYTAKNRIGKQCSKCGKHLKSRWLFHESKCPGTKIESEPKITWRSERHCKGCGKKFLPQTRSHKTYCDKQCNLLNRDRLSSDSAKENRRNAGKAARERNGSGYKPGSGRSKSGWYRNIWCDSSWELAFLIYHLDNGNQIDRNTIRYFYDYQGKQSYYLPDFIVNGKLYEIKGFLTDRDKIKHSVCSVPLIVIGKVEIQPFLSYVIQRYGHRFIDLYTRRVNPTG